MSLSQKHIFLFISATIVMSTLVAYEPIRHNGFVNYDDDKYITKNPDVTGGITRQSLEQVFTKPHIYMWHPLTIISHMLDYEFFGLNPTGHHLVSVLIHIVNALLLFWILNNLTGVIWLSAFVAAVFALHPLQVESVAWAAERKTVLSGLFWLLTMVTYIHYVKQPRLGRYLMVLLVFGLCIMTKPVVVTLPFALLLLDYWPLDRVRWGPSFAEATEGRQKASVKLLIIEKIPLLAMSAILAVITINWQHLGGVIQTLEKEPMGYRIANMFLSYIRYIGKMIWPSRLAVFYPHPQLDVSDTKVLICAILLILLTGICIYTGRRRKYVAVGWLWFVVTLIPMIGLVQSGEQAMANRYMYISMLGLLIIIACAAKDFIASRPRVKIAAIILGLAAISCFIVLTRMQVRHWQNSITLYEYALKVTQNNALAENNYGSALFEAGRFDEAMLHLNNSIRIQPIFFHAHYNLGKVFLIQGKTSEAITCFNDALRQNGGSAQAHYDLGIALGMQGKYSDAIKCFEKALSLDSNYPDARYKMGLALMATNRPNEAIACFNELINRKHGTAEVYYNLAIALGMQNKYEEAIKQLSKTLEMEPGYPDAHNRMGIALMAIGKPDEAIKYFDKALRINKDTSEVYGNLGTAYMRMGKYGPGIYNFNKAVEQKPDSIVNLNRLAWAMATVEDTSLRDANKAIEAAGRACELTGDKDAEYLDTLAVTYAAADRFEEAKATAEKALSIAKANRQEDLAGAIEKRIKLYETGQPYRQK
jgi:protein O-mannosyl-transferase